MGYQWKGKWTGINVPTLTCFKDDFRVDYNATRALFRSLATIKGLAGIAVNVHTGEGEVLSIDERKKIIQIAQEEAKGRFPITTGIHANTYEEGIWQAREMEKTGVDALMVLAPNIYLFDAREAPECGIQFHKAIAKTVNLPLVMHQVYGTINEYPTDAFVKMFNEIDNLVAVKIAGTFAPWRRYEKDLRALRAIGRENVSLFPGGSFWSTFLWGVDGAWSGFGNFGCERLVALLTAVRENRIEEARTLNEQISALEEVLYVKPMVDLIARYKQVTHFVGAIPSAVVRPPKVHLDDQEKARLRKALEAAEMLPVK